MKIQSVTLETPALKPVIDFYQSALGLEVITADPGMAHVQVGSSWLIFRENPAFEGIYHFAFNIPGNQIREGMSWLERASISLISNEKGETQIDFPNWNAEAAYFFDPAGNIVELIARRDLQNESDQPFSPQSLTEISEIGIVTDDVPAWNSRAETEFGILPFDKQKPSSDFSALGTDMGLFIVVGAGRNWFLTDIPAQRLPLKVRFENDRGEEFEL
jgi:catechol-2,3-dioxygenase